MEGVIMKKVHLCCGDVYLSGYENCDIDGFVWDSGKSAAIRTTQDEFGPESQTLEFLYGNPNATTLDKYFKFPFEVDITKRVRRYFIVDTIMNVLEQWHWENGSVDEIVSVSAFEHFEHLTELPHIIKEVYRVLKPGGIWKFDFPDIRGVVRDYHDSDPEFMAELIYCNHKNKYSVHQWGYTTKSVSKYVTPDKWSLEFKDVVSHCYPM